MRLFILASILLVSLSGFSQQYFLYIGTYTEGPFKNGPSDGIYIYRFDAATGDTKLVDSAATDNPSYLSIAPGGKFLYAANETDGPKPGSVSAFSIDSSTGKLQFLDKQASGGEDPCFVSVDAHRKWLMVANYSGGSLSGLPIRPDGSLAALSQTIQHTGTGPNKERQEKAHVHSVNFAPDQKYLVAADLGKDELSIYHFDWTAGVSPLRSAKDSIVHLKPGSGPRHLDYYAGRPYVYALAELTGTIDAYQYSNGQLTPFQRISTHPDGYNGSIGSADIHLTPNGKFLYASNRGDANSLAIFAVDPATGRLSLKGFQSTGGKTPRNFVIDPSGKWLLAANQNTHNVVIFRINAQTGLLTDIGKPIDVMTPVCLKLVRTTKQHS